MKKIITIFTSLLIFKAHAFRVTDPGGIFLPIGISDSTLEYLKGDWVQSYRAHLYFRPLCELACYPLFNACYADYYKFEVAPVKISYRKWSDSTAGIIRPAATQYSSPTLNEQFSDQEGAETDTIYLVKKSLIWVVDTLKNRSTITHFLNKQIKNTHYYHFYTESEKVVFERVAHRELGKYLTQYNWMFNPCSFEKGVNCLGTSYLEHLYLKNDTIYTLNAKAPAFVYNEEAHGYTSVVNKAVGIQLSNDSSKIELTLGGTVVASYPKVANVEVSDDSKYLGVWTSTTAAEHKIEISKDGHELLAKRVLDTEGNLQLRVGKVYSVPSIALAADERAAIPMLLTYAFFKSEDECTPSYSRFALSLDGTTLTDQYTGEIFTKVTGMAGDYQPQELLLKHNPIVDGKLILEHATSIDYEIYTAAGSLVQQGVCSDKVDVSTLDRGIYLFKAVSDKNGKTFKFMIAD